MNENFIGFTFLRCFFCSTDLGVFDTIDYCDYRCHAKDIIRRKKKKRTDVYFVG